MTANSHAIHANQSFVTLIVLCCRSPRVTSDPAP
jgi:hypothetical protein